MSSIEDLPKRLQKVRSEMKWTAAMLSSLSYSSVIESLTLEQSLDSLIREEKSIKEKLGKIRM